MYVCVCVCVCVYNLITQDQIKVSKRNRLGANYGSDLELLIAKFRLKLKKVGNTTLDHSGIT